MSRRIVFGMVIASACKVCLDRIATRQYTDAYPSMQAEISDATTKYCDMINEINSGSLDPEPLWLMNQAASDERVRLSHAVVKIAAVNNWLRMNELQRFVSWTSLLWQV